MMPRPSAFSHLTGKSNDSTVLDATNGKVIGTVKLAGKPEEAILDGNGNMWGQHRGQERHPGIRHEILRD